MLGLALFLYKEKYNAIELILLCVWAELAVLGSAKTALKFNYEIQIGYYIHTIQCMGQIISFKSEINNP
jgi:hypothetical protein